MTLKVDDSLVHENSTSSDIIDAMQSIARKENEFLTLFKGKLTYLTVSRENDMLYSIEYQDGSLKEHYYCHESITADQAKSALQSYLKGDKSWMRKFEWHENELEGRPSFRDAVQFDGRIFVIGMVAMVVCSSLFFARQWVQDQRIIVYIFFILVAIFITILNFKKFRSGKCTTESSEVKRSGSPIKFWIRAGYFFVLGVAIIILCGKALYRYFKK